MTAAIDMLAAVRALGGEVRRAELWATESHRASTAAEGVDRSSNCGRLSPIC